MTKKIAVIYLARAQEGLPCFEKFAVSYRKYKAGQEHDLIIVYKGDFKKGERAAAEHLFKDLATTSFSMSDEGFDIHGYLYAAKNIKHTYICCFNTYTELLSENWLNKLYSNLQKPDVGLVGITGSYESIYSSHEIIQNVCWLSLNDKCRFNKQLFSQFKWIITLLPPSPFKNDRSLIKKIFSQKNFFGALLSVFYLLNYKKNKYLRSFIYDKIINRNKSKYYDNKLKVEFRNIWNTITTNGSLKFLSQFPRFPNPHIRSNGYMLERKIFLEFDPIENTKEACCAFESSFDGLTNTILRKGLEVLVVGADGLGYPIEEWINSRTFRLANQENLLAHDNQTLRYKEFSQGERDVHHYLTWGDYTSYPPKTIENLRYRLRKATPLISLETQRKISVVIPTRNRLSLLKEAVFSILKQHYKNWELIIFDNASSEPIEEYISSLKDKRIKFRRSEDFLPVTESWNQAISYATGEYVLFLGDDDGILPNYFEKVNDLIIKFREPDLIYSSLYMFAYPGVIPGIREGFLNMVHNGFFFGEREEPFILEKKLAKKAWKGSINFQRNFAFNMQAMTFNRLFLEKLKIDGKVFHSPFPDYYLANMAMEKGEKILICPEPLSIQGVSTASFGYTLFNNLENEGASLLNTDLSKDKLYDKYKHVFLPGPEYHTKYILTMGYVAKYVSELVNTKAGISRYRLNQIAFHVTRQKNIIKWLKTDVGKSVWSKLKLYERLMMMYFYLLKLTKVSLADKIIAYHTSNMAFTPRAKRIATGEFAKLSEIFNMLEETKS